MRRVSVWAFEGIPELEYQTGFVPVEAGMAEELIAAGKVQDPRVGGTALKCRRVNVLVPMGEYGTKQLTAKTKKTKTKG